MPKIRAKQIENISINERIINLEERLFAIEMEQRKIKEDILSGNPTKHMYKRMLERPKEKLKEERKFLENYKIEI
jgi:hypothetical protein